MSVTARWAWCLAIAAIAALCGEEVRTRQMHQFVQRPHTGQLPNAYFIVTPEECDGVFDFLSIFDRHDVFRRVQLDGIYVLGSATDSADVSAVARAHDLRTTIRRASTSMSLQRDALGYGTAVLVVTDVHERVLLARGVPSSPAGYDAFAELLTFFPI